MKFKRMAVVAAAAVVGPSVLMATPAMADEVKNPAVTTPDTEPKGDAAGSETAYNGPRLALDGLPEDGFEAGGEWTDLTLRMDNSEGKDLSSYDIGMSFSGTDPAVKGAHIEVEHRYAGVWQPADRKAGPGPQTASFDVLSGIPVAQDKSIQIPVRVRVAADAPASPLRIQVTGTNRKDVNSRTAQYTSKTTRQEQAAKAPALSLSGLPENGFKAGDATWRTLTLKVDNSGRPGTGEFHLGVDLVGQHAEVRPDQVEVEYFARTTDGTTYWEPIEVTKENGKVRIFNFGGEYGAGEQRDLVLRVRFAGDTPQTSFALNVFGAGDPHHGGAVADTATYSSHVASGSGAVEVEGPKVSVDGIPAGGFRAGADWQELQLHLDNAGRPDLKDFLVSARMGRGFNEGPWVTPGQVKLQAYGADGWYDVAIDGSEEVMGGDLGEVSLGAGAKTVLKLRLRFTEDTTSGAFHLMFGGYAHTDKGEFVSSSTPSLPTHILAAGTADPAAGGQNGGNGNGNGNGNQPKPDGGSGPAAGQGATAGGGKLATAGADPATSWALGGAGLAVAMGAALVAGTGKRRRPTA
ncbi:hypothetical protein KPP03845_103409 [Streptomyces xanthophaeus]|uniref:hypothetical protein n=1 Tax=Streptomyces xanthophaeus TaxID=67385 RepID=UPI00233EBD3B|nr:hypothetical protein [Streptomyces xanthophaeus]WCD87041.1 hypothetical protein KPP03845_103409 [Streptomyces xanthophaeus]